MSVAARQIDSPIHIPVSYTHLYEWGLVKSNWINEYVLVRDSEGKIKASLSILLRKTPLINLYYMYAPRGPICDLRDKQALKAIAIIYIPHDKAVPLARLHHKLVEHRNILPVSYTHLDVYKRQP